MFSFFCFFICWKYYFLNKRTKIFYFFFGCLLFYFTHQIFYFIRFKHFFILLYFIFRLNLTFKRCFIFSNVLLLRFLLFFSLSFLILFFSSSFSFFCPFFLHGKRTQLCILKLAKYPISASKLYAL